MSDQENTHRHSTSATWNVTFVDLLSLLLTFFVLLFSMSSVKSAGWDGLINAMSDQFSEKEAKLIQTPESTKATTQRLRGLNARYLASVLQEEFKADPVFQGGGVFVRGQDVILSIPVENLFPNGSYDLDMTAVKKLSGIGIKLAQLPNSVIIAGYSDQDNKVLPPYRTSDEKALAQARSVATALHNRGYHGHMTMISKPLAKKLHNQQGDIIGNDFEHIEIILLEKGVERGIYDLLQ